MPVMKSFKPVQISLLVALTIVSVNQVANAKPSDEKIFKAFTGPNGCLIERLTSGDYDEFQHQGASQDGQWLSVGWNKGKDADGNPIRGSYRLNLVTGEKSELAAPLNHNSSFSYDGLWLVGAHYTADGKSDIFEYNVKTGRANVIAQSPSWEFLSSYSPDGQYILFNSYRSGNSEIYLYDRSAKTMKQLTQYDGYDAHGEFSPDGSKISFHRQVKKRADGGYDFDLYSYDLASGKETRLTATSLEESYASWAPDGETLVMSLEVEGQPTRRNLYVRASDGTYSQLTYGDWKDSYAYWLRDGSYIYFNSDRSENSAIYRIKMKGLVCEKGN